MDREKRDETEQVKSDFNMLWKGVVGVLTALAVSGLGAMLAMWSDVAVLRQIADSNKTRISALELTIANDGHSAIGREGRLGKIEARLDAMGEQLRRIERIVERRDDREGMLGPINPDLLPPQKRL